MTEASFHPAWALIREARSRAGLTQSALAERAGTTQSAIAAYERARRLPDLPTLTRIVESCGLELQLRLVESDPQRINSENAAFARNVTDRLETNASFTHAATAFRTSRG